MGWVSWPFVIGGCDGLGSVALRDQKKVLPGRGAWKNPIEASDTAWSVTYIGIGGVYLEFKMPIFYINLLQIHI